ncbi:DUF2480 family protein [Jiulongibacter sp. NS-SX5]|uniref:DUF2480 family protein n=1 Tax=Jiulongibacter sp. NS-SX5 TaxID=3463854 RepID=UPI00405802A1
MAEEIINRVAASGLITFDLEDYYHPGERVVYDLKDNLFMEAILKEKDFRAFLKENDWSVYEGKNVAIYCSVDAIIPTWAYMLLALRLEGIANVVVFGDLKDLEIKLFRDALSTVDFEQFKDTRVVVKGCSKVDMPTEVYVDLSQRLKPLVKSLMFGEPCSTVPLYKKPKI